MSPIPPSSAAAPAARTLGELRASGYSPETLRAEIHANLQARLRERANLFPGVKGYEDSVIRRSPHPATTTWRPRPNRSLQSARLRGRVRLS
jgi:hypothetical protein